MKKNGLSLIGRGTDESPNAYKDIHKVMQHKDYFIEIKAVFYPKTDEVLQEITCDGLQSFLVLFFKYFERVCLKSLIVTNYL